MEPDKRKHPRSQADIVVRFNLNPDYHYVPAIRKLGVGATVRDISVQGLRIDSQIDLLDVCQIFSEAIEDNSVFALEVFFVNSEGTKTLIRGEVRWIYGKKRQQS